MAGIGPSDVDVVQLYDAFTINTILFLEDLGFCRKGEGGPFVSDGNIAPGGDLPVNTNGGGLSFVHPECTGSFCLGEAAIQLRRQAGKRQVAEAEIALSHRQRRHALAPMHHSSRIARKSVTSKQEFCMSRFKDIFGFFLAAGCGAPAVAQIKIGVTVSATGPAASPRNSGA